MKRAQEEHKQARERECADFFLSRYNSLNGTNYGIINRPEDMYPGLPKYWDWVCRDPSGGKPEMAIEVTELGEPEEQRAAAPAIRSFINDLERDLAGSLSGEFLLVLEIPGFSRDLQKRAKLRELLVAAIRTAASEMRPGESRELAQDEHIMNVMISAQRPEFRKRLRKLYEWRQESDDIYHEIGCTISKSSGEGSTLSVLSCYEGEVACGKIAHKNRQLQAAKDRIEGAITVLLLDRRYMQDFENVEGGLRLLEPKDYSAIDHICFVDIEEQEVRELHLPRTKQDKPWKGD
jgi:hypothetical protein